MFDINRLACGAKKKQLIRGKAPEPTYTRRCGQHTPISSLSCASLHLRPAPRRVSVGVVGGSWTAKKTKAIQIRQSTPSSTWLVCPASVLGQASPHTPTGPSFRTTSPSCAAALAEGDLHDKPISRRAESTEVNEQLTALRYELHTTPTLHRADKSYSEVQRG